MKITILSKTAIVVVATLLFACGAENKEEKAVVEKETPEVKETPVEPAPIVAEMNEEPEKEEVVASSATKILTGEDKIGNSDCLSCHLKERQVVGPAFLDIAAEYENNDENVSMLANKVIQGGAGVWGEAAMPPHPSLSEEDAKDMVRYILGLS
ncbi:c-type cytochrome [Algoriphagus sp. SE2]|uniref:c-type cytochrome n=1 Tax=Algoriphagus sp. SE2 TaxID=3141536 RepID=UPI0031CDA91F